MSIKLTIMATGTLCGEWLEDEVEDKARVEVGKSE